MKIKNTKYFPFHFVQIIFYLFSFIQSHSQSNFNYQEKYRVKIARTKETIKIDGELSEPAWQTADMATGFWQTISRDKDAAKHQTQVRLTYNDEFIFVAIKCFDTIPYIIAT